MIFFFPNDPDEKPYSDGKSRRQMALIGVDVEVPKCANIASIPGAKCGEGIGAKDVDGCIEGEGVVFEEFDKGKRTIEEKKENREEGNLFVLKKLQGKRPDAPEKEGKPQDARDVEGPIEPESRFFQQPDEGIKQKMITDGLTGEDGVLGGLKFGYPIKIISHGK